MKNITMIFASVAVAGVMTFGASQADARSSWSVGFHTGHYGYYNPAPVCYPTVVRRYHRPVYSAPAYYYGPSYYSPGYYYAPQPSLSFSYSRRR